MDGWLMFPRIVGTPAYEEKHWGFLAYCQFQHQTFFVARQYLRLVFRQPQATLAQEPYRYCSLIRHVFPSLAPTTSVGNTSGIA
jgi:hypothetical protein